jgi:hypothetical protein
MRSASSKKAMEILQAGADPYSLAASDAQLVYENRQELADVLNHQMTDLVLVIQRVEESRKPFECEVFAYACRGD